MMCETLVGYMLGGMAVMVCVVLSLWMVYITVVLWAKVSEEYTRKKVSRRLRE